MQWSSGMEDALSPEQKFLEDSVQNMFRSFADCVVCYGFRESRSSLASYLSTEVSASCTEDLASFGEMLLGHGLFVNMQE